VKINRKRILALLLLVLITSAFAGRLLYSKSMNADQTDMIPTQNSVDSKTLDTDTAPPAMDVTRIAAQHADPNSLIHALNSKHGKNVDDDMRPSHKKGDDDRPTTTPLLPSAAFIGSGLASLVALRRQRKFAPSK
jgi:hypothetical protein